MTDVFMANDTIKALYGLDPDPERTFEDQFSKVSLESILFHVVATCIWTLEKMFDRHKQEVDELISELKPHSYFGMPIRQRLIRTGAVFCRIRTSMITQTSRMRRSVKSRW